MVPSIRPGMSNDVSGLFYLIERNNMLKIKDGAGWKAQVTIHYLNVVRKKYNTLCFPSTWNVLWYLIWKSHDYVDLFVATTNQEIAEDMGISERNVRKQMDLLILLGVIKRKYKGWRKGNESQPSTYVVCSPKEQMIIESKNMNEIQKLL